MNNFTFNIPTDIRFGKEQIQCLPEELSKYGKKVLLVYGGGSIKKTGLYDTVTKLLGDFEVYELPGIEPNPKLTSVETGAKICKEKGIEVILAVGGGSTIDASKHIACAACYDGPAWDLMMDRSKIKSALPIAVVLTICATGSEMNSGGVITNEDTKEKLEINSPLLYPRLSICDPTYLYTLPPKQTAAGAVDILSHVLEQYFQPNDEAFITDTLSEAVMKTVVKYAKKALDVPDDYEARSNLMWSSTVALNHLLTVGKGGGWSVHPIEHVVSAFYDITHGVGLAIITPKWMRFVLSNDTVDRFVRYAEEVWGIYGSDKFAVAMEGIDKTEEFFVSLGMPKTLYEAGITDDRIKEMAKEAYRTNNEFKRAYVKLSEGDIETILSMCK